MLGRMDPYRIRVCESMPKASCCEYAIALAKLVNIHMQTCTHTHTCHINHTRANESICAPVLNAYILLQCVCVCVRLELSLRLRGYPSRDCRMVTMHARALALNMHANTKVFNGNAILVLVSCATCFVSLTVYMNINFEPNRLQIQHRQFVECTYVLC